MAKTELPVLIKRLKAWRTKNDLSQRGAAEVMQRAGYPVKLSSIVAWENRVRAPSALAAKAVQDFLEDHPRITDPPKYGRWHGRDKRK